MADVGPGMLQQRANLNLGLQSQNFRRNGDRDAGVLELLRIDQHDVMHRAVAELGRAQSLAYVLAVGPIDVERLLDELAHGPHLIGGLGDDAPAAEVRDAGQRICGQCAFRVQIGLAFAEDLLGEAGDAFGTCLDQGQRRRPGAALFENRLQKVRVEKVTGADCHESRHLQCYPALIGQGCPFLDFFPRLSHLPWLLVLSHVRFQRLSRICPNFGRLQRGNALQYSRWLFQAPFMGLRQLFFSRPKGET